MRTESNEEKAKVASSPRQTEELQVLKETEDLLSHKLLPKMEDVDCQKPCKEIDQNPKSPKTLASLSPNTNINSLPLNITLPLLAAYQKQI
jgi:hypothetical protein